MSGLFKQFQTDPELEINGVYVAFDEAPNDDETIPTFLLARSGGANKAYSKALEAATRPYRKQIENGGMKNEKAEEIHNEVFANTILKGWKNVQDASGDEIPYSKDAALKLFKDLPDVYARLQDEARVASNYRAQAVEAEAKNS